MQIYGLPFINHFRSEEVINTAWQTFSSKVRPAEELEILAGGGELNTCALSEGLGLYFCAQGYVPALLEN